MRDGILRRFVRLGEGDAQIVGKEEAVVAEPALAAAFVHDRAVGAPLRNDLFAVRIDERGGAAKVGAALFFLQIFEEKGAVCRVSPARIAGAVYPGRPAERLHAQPAVVCERRKPRRL